MSVNKVVLNGETIIDLSNDTVSEDSVVQGYTFHDKDGVKKTGTRSPYVSEFMPSGTLQITENGKYNVESFAEAEVSVYPELEDKTVSINYGQATNIPHSQGVYGMKSVTVSVNRLTQEKTITKNGQDIDVEYCKTADVDVSPIYENIGSESYPHFIQYGETKTIGLSSYKDGNDYKGIKYVTVKTTPLTENKEISSVSFGNVTDATTEVVTSQIDVEKKKTATLKLQYATYTIRPTSAYDSDESFKYADINFDKTQYAGLAGVRLFLNTSNLWTRPSTTSEKTLTSNGEEVVTQGYYKVKVQIPEYDGSSTIEAISVS